MVRTAGSEARCLGSKGLRRLHRRSGTPRDSCASYRGRESSEQARRSTSDLEPGARQISRAQLLLPMVVGGRRSRVERASPIPFGVGHTKPHHFVEIAKTIWRNKHAPRFTWRILRDGVCDGCALGTTGLKDFTMDGVHLCTVRLNLLPLNTMGSLHTPLLEDVSALGSFTSKELRELGRLPWPMIRARGAPGFRRISWGEAIALAAGRIRHTTPDRLAFFLTSRGVTNETYYVASKVARFLGTNNVDNSSRGCPAPSTTGMKDSLGVAASTCSYSDWIGSDLLVFFGGAVAHHP